MDLHLVDVLSYPMCTLACAIIFPLIAAIATFVCFRRAKASQRLIGFFMIVPVFVALTVLVCGDTASIASGVLPAVGLYPVVGFLAAICLGTVGLNFIAVICGAGLLSRKGAVINTVASFVCFCANAFITFCAWRFADNAYKSATFRNDAGKIDIKDAFDFLSLDFLSLDFLPSGILDSGIELLSLLIFALFLAVYFLSFLALKTPEQIAKDDLERRRLAALKANGSKASRAKKEPREDEGEDDLRKLCASCQFATPLKGDRTKMVCDKCGVVSATHTCRKYLYDPLKRVAFRPVINPLVPDDTSSDPDHI